MSDLDDMKDTMSEPNIETPEEQSIGVPLYLTDDIDKTFALAMNITSDFVMHEPTCPFCRSAHREEMETKYLETKLYKDVKDIAQGRGESDISNAVIKNHMTVHWEAGSKEIQKGEYAEKIRRLNSVNLTTLDRLRICLSALTERLIGVNSIVPDGSTSAADVEKIKSSETQKIMGSFEKLLKLQAQVTGDLKTSGELITMPRREFTEYFKNAIIGAKDQRDKDIIMDVLDNLKSLGKSVE